MKTIIILAILSLTTITAQASIKGTLVLKGKANLTATYKNVAMKCKINISDISNAMLEDDEQNPAYKVRATLSVKGKDKALAVDVNTTKTLTFTNLHTADGKKTVSDEQYNAASDVQFAFTIDDKGRVTSMSVPFESEIITCKR